RGDARLAPRSRGPRALVPRHALRLRAPPSRSAPARSRPRVGPRSGRSAAALAARSRPPHALDLRPARAFSPLARVWPQAEIRHGLGAGVERLVRPAWRARRPGGDPAPPRPGAHAPTHARPAP